MKIYSPKAIGIVFCAYAVSFTVSCSKDTDLLEDYVVSQEIQAFKLQNLVIDDNYISNGSNSIVLDVLSNDVFDNPDKVKIVDISEPASGTVTINEDKTLTYTPNTATDANTESSVDTEVDDQTDTEEGTDNSEEPAVVEEETESPESENPSEKQNNEEQTNEESDQTTADQNGQEENQGFESTDEEVNDVTQNSSENDDTETEENPTADDFTYTVETTDDDGNTTTQEGTVHIDLDYGELKAFPGAEGFGKYTTGGRGGKVIYVNNLNDGGPGSLRAALEQNGLRTVVFKVSGYITLNTPLVISNGDITIAGQTAPGEGITVRLNPVKDMPTLRITTSNVIVRGIRFRPGKTSTKAVNGDALTLTGGSNIIIDHCSFSWSTDEVVNPYGASRITFQNCIFSEALMFATHTYTTDPNNNSYYRGHSMGMLVGNTSNKITIYNSVFAHNNQRNPLIGGSIARGTDFELVNNVYYNWGDYGTVLAPENQSFVNLINNLHIPGNDSRNSRYPILLKDNVKVYAKGNVNNFREDNSLPEIYAIGARKAPFNSMANPANLTNQPFDYPLADTNLVQPEKLLPMVTNSAGAFKKDEVDLRIVSDIKNGTGHIIDSPSEVGGYPSLAKGLPYTDTDQDGMSDDWERDHNLDPNDPDDGKADFNEDGFTNLEDFLHFKTQRPF